MKAVHNKATQAVIRISLTPGKMIRTIRELQEMSQADLASACDIPQPTISALESGRVKLGVERAERLARALKVHPSVLVWPQWEGEDTRLPS